MIRELIDQTLEAAQSEFIQADNSAAAVAVTGPAGSGKTRALLQRVCAELERRPSHENVLLLTPADPLPPARSIDDLVPEHLRPRVVVGTFFELSEFWLREYYAEFGLATEPVFLSDQAATARLGAVAADLCDLAWPEFLNGQLDPEVSGIRTPERFFQTTYRFLERLRSAAIDPGRLAEMARRGTTLFYAAPPNFADAELIRATKDAYRDSLRVSAANLDHQRRREADLATIVAKLADIENEATENDGVFSPYQALNMLTRCLRSQPKLCAALATRFPAVLIDDAQDLGVAERQLLDAVYSETWRGIAFACNAEGSVRGLEGVRPQETLAKAAQSFALSRRYRGNAVLWNLEATIMAPILGPQPPQVGIDLGAAPAVGMLRAADRPAQAAAVREYVRTRLGADASTPSCAILVRSLACAWQYIEELLAADIPVDIAGPVEPLWDRATADVHALLLTLASRREAAAFLRLAESPLLRLSDRSTAVLSQAPGEPTLFALDPQSREKKARDPERLAHTVLDGLNDTAFESATIERLTRFRRYWQSWHAAFAARPTLATLKEIVGESGLVAGTNATAGLAQAMSARYFNALERLWPQSNGDATVLRRVLQQYDALRLIEAPPLSTPVLLPGAVVVATVEAMRGHEFDIVIIPDAKAGAFPRYYVPDAFVFSPTRGFIPRDNVGAQGAGRTAKFTWYLHAVGARASYNREERRLFAFAISRARKNVVIAAAGPPTRGIAAPEFLEEIRRAGLHGVEDLRRSAQSNPRTENIF